MRCKKCIPASVTEPPLPLPRTLHIFLSFPTPLLLIQKLLFRGSVRPLLPTLCPFSLLPLDLESQRVTSGEAGEEVDGGGQPLSPVPYRPPSTRLLTSAYVGSWGKRGRQGAGGGSAGRGVGGREGGRRRLVVEVPSYLYVVRLGAGARPPLYICMSPTSVMSVSGRFRLAS